MVVLRWPEKNCTEKVVANGCIEMVVLRWLYRDGCIEMVVLRWPEKSCTEKSCDQKKIWSTFQILETPI
jgi:hypothetical protein